MEAQTRRRGFPILEGRALKDEFTGPAQDDRPRTASLNVATPAPLIGEMLQELSAHVSKLLDLFANGKYQFGLTAEEIAIFLAIGHSSLVCAGAIPALKPISYQHISDSLGIPKATVRRKTIRLIDKKLVSATSRGVMVQDIRAWAALTEVIIS
jgi:hypothetical protein